MKQPKEGFGGVLYSGHVPQNLQVQQTVPNNFVRISFYLTKTLFVFTIRTHTDSFTPILRWENLCFV